MNTTTESNTLTMAERVKHFLLLTRPYSYADNIARGFLVCALFGEAHDLRLMLSTATASTLMWLFLNWWSDSIQKQPGRLVPHSIWVWIPVALTIPVAALQGTVGIIGLAVYVLAIQLYPWKAKIKKLGVYGPILRGVTVAAHYFFLVTMMPPNAVPASCTVAIGFVLVFAHSARNLVGDIRDIKQDRYELPAKFGFRPAMMWTHALLLCALFAGLFVPRWEVSILGPIAVQWASLQMLSLAWGRTRPHHVGYVGHRLFVLTFTTMQILLGYQHGVSLSVCVALSVVAIVTHLTYSYVPGKKYPTFGELINPLRVISLQESIPTQAAPPPHDSRELAHITEHAGVG